MGRILGLGVFYKIMDLGRVTRREKAGYRHKVVFSHK